MTAKLPHEMDEQEREQWRDELVDDYVDPSGSPGAKPRAVEHLRHHDLLPVELPNGDWLVDGETDIFDGRHFVKKTQRIVDRECPECGYDRCDGHYFNNGVINAGSVECRACGHTLEQHAP